MHLLPVVDGEEQWDRRNRFFYFLKLPFCIAPLNLIYSPSNTLYSNVAAFEAIRNYKSISVKEVIRGFGAHMMNTLISNTNRFQSADAVGTLMNCILNTTKNSWQFKKMDRNNDIHLQNVRYLLNRLDAAESNEEKNCEEVAI